MVGRSVLADESRSPISRFEQPSAINLSTSNSFGQAVDGADRAAVWGSLSRASNDAARSASMLMPKVVAVCACSARIRRWRLRRCCGKHGLCWTWARHTGDELRSARSARRGSTRRPDRGTRADGRALQAICRTEADRHRTHQVPPSVQVESRISARACSRDPGNAGLGKKREARRPHRVAGMAAKSCGAKASSSRRDSPIMPSSA